MKKYNVEIMETLLRVIEVEADTVESAMEEAMADYYTCKHVLDSEDFKYVNF